MKLLVISICMNEAETIGQVLDAVPSKIPGIDIIEKLVIDDGSSDKTVEVAKKHGAKTISDGANKKLAWRFREAVEVALTEGADIMVNIDGDMQFDPADIPELVQPILDEQADFVAADRFTGTTSGKPERPHNMPIGKYLGNKVGAKVVSKLSHQPFKDVTCGFRAYNRESLIVLNLNGVYTYTQESFQVLAMKKMRIVSMPVEVKYYPGRKSRVVKNFMQYVFSSAINILRSYRDYAPLSFFGLLGFIFFVPAAALLAFTAVHWIRTDVFSPYKAVGLAGLYLFSMSLFLWSLGLVADMFDRMLNNQEKIIERQKRQQYKRRSD